MAGSAAKVAEYCKHDMNDLSARSWAGNAHH